MTNLYPKTSLRRPKYSHPCLASAEIHVQGLHNVLLKEGETISVIAPRAAAAGRRRRGPHGAGGTRDTRDSARVRVVHAVPHLFPLGSARPRRALAAAATGWIIMHGFWG